MSNRAVEWLKIVFLKNVVGIKPWLLERYAYEQQHKICIFQLYFLAMYVRISLKQLQKFHYI